ncbi:MAG: hypothetical protein H0W72_04510 [Planctomycetes bacterium]|nr:hypothetical protein [Planctomycetota bacterium]
MADTYTLILRECTEAARSHVAQFLGKAFSLKDNTSATIAGSAPIALLSDLTIEEAAAIQLVMSSIHADGVTIQFSREAPEDLPKIDWPRRPLVFKREIAEYVRDLAMPLPCPDCGKLHPLIRLLADRLMQRWGGSTSMVYQPHEADRASPLTASSVPARQSPNSREFHGSSMPEITPFSNEVLPPTPSPATAKPQRPAAAAAPAAPAAAGSDDAVTRLNELFPEEEGMATTGNFIPNNNDITNILNRLLPDEESSARTGAPSSGRLTAMPSSGFSVFLAKIGDEARRAKAVPLLAELGKISNEEADALSKKVIIPVLKGVTKDEAEAAKQRFAKIGILARVKGAETAA